MTDESRRAAMDEASGLRRRPMMQLGESFVGSGADCAHVNTVLGHRDGPVGTAWATALASPSTGHVPFVCVIRPDLPVQPMTLFVTKAAIASRDHGTLVWGAAQAGVAGGVADAVRAGTIDADHLDALALIVAVWVDPAAGDARAVCANNRQATATALARGAAPGDVAAMLAEADRPWNPYFGPIED